jgi:TolA-binding protein
MESGSTVSSLYSSNSISSTTGSNTYPVQRSYSQQMLTPMTPELDPSTSNTNNSTNNVSAQQAQQRRQVIHHLALLLHAHKCLQREQQQKQQQQQQQQQQQDICNGDNHTSVTQYSCTLPHCAHMRTVLQHMTTCSDFKTCSCKF